MKTLFILRHAKAVSEDDSGEDHARALNERGRQACEAIGTFLQEVTPWPQAIYASTSTRTRETAERVIAAFEPQNAPSVTLDKSLYLATPGTLLYAVSQLPDSLSSVMFIGHNPGLHVMAQELSRKGDQTLIQRIRQNFPTAALAVLRFNTSRWSDAHSEGGELLHFITPKQLVSTE